MTTIGELEQQLLDARRISMMCGATDDRVERIQYIEDKIELLRSETMDVQLKYINDGVNNDDVQDNYCKELFSGLDFVETDKLIIKTDRVRNYIFVINNYTATNLKYFKDVVSKDKSLRYIVFGQEVGSLTHTKHLQGFVSFHDAKSASACKKLLNATTNKKMHKMYSLTTKAHIEICRCTSTFRAIDYCCKGEQSKQSWKDEGTASETFGLNSVVIEYGEKCLDKNLNLVQESWDRLKSDIKLGFKMTELAEKHTELYLKYHTGFENLYNLLRPKKKFNILDLKLKLFQWEYMLLDILSNPWDDRKILWFFDDIGCSDKSTFLKHIISNYDFSLISSGKSADMIYNWHENNVVIDIPRKMNEFFNYNAVEEIKNGICVNNKYVGKVKMYNEVGNPMIIVFSNSMPDFKAMSCDRFVVKVLTKYYDGKIISKRDFKLRNECGRLYNDKYDIIASDYVQDIEMSKYIINEDDKIVCIETGQIVESILDDIIENNIDIGIIDD